MSAHRLRWLVAGSGPVNVSTCQGDAYRLPFYDTTFDVVYCRLLLQYLRAPQHAVHEMYRVLRPGGHLVLYDLDGQFLWHDPPDDQLNEAIASVVKALARSGFDPHVGRRLYNLAHGAGLVDIVTRVEVYHLIPGRVSPDEHSRWQLKLDIAMPALTQVLKNASQVNRQIAAFLSYLDREDSLTYSVAFAVSGRKE